MYYKTIIDIAHKNLSSSFLLLPTYQRFLHNFSYKASQSRQRNEGFVLLSVLKLTSCEMPVTASPVVAAVTRSPGKLTLMKLPLSKGTATVALYIYSLLSPSSFSFAFYLVIRIFRRRPRPRRGCCCSVPLSAS